MSFYDCPLWKYHSIIEAPSSSCSFPSPPWTRALSFPASSHPLSLSFFLRVVAFLHLHLFLLSSLIASFTNFIISSSLLAIPHPSRFELATELPSLASFRTLLLCYTHLEGSSLLLTFVHRPHYHPLLCYSRLHSSRESCKSSAMNTIGYGSFVLIELPSFFWLASVFQTLGLSSWYETFSLLPSGKGCLHLLFTCLSPLALVYSLYFPYHSLSRITQFASAVVSLFPSTLCSENCTKHCRRTVISSTKR